MRFAESVLGSNFSLSLRLMVVGVSALYASSASAALTVIPAFTGTYSETLESFPPQSVQLFVPNPTPFFGTHAVLTVTGNANAVKAIAIYTGPSGAAPFGNFQPSDGTQFAISQDFSDVLSITFDQSATQFGGFFAAGQSLGFTFFDGIGGTVGSGTYVPTGTGQNLSFLGLSSTVPFRTVRITPTTPDLVPFDGLQVTIPEPASATLLTAGALTLLRRRSKPSVR